MTIPQTSRSQRWRVLRRSATFWVGSTIVVIWVVFAIFGDFVTPFDPLGTPADVLNRLEAPSGEHPLGTDELGRDVLSRVLAGARQVLTVALAATVLGTLLGTALGLLVGYAGGILDDILSHILDAFLSIPLVITGMLALTALGPNTLGVVVVIGLVFTPIIAKTVRAAVLSERQLDYVTAAQLRRDNTLYVLFVEILPNVANVIIVEFTVRLGYAIFTVLALSFLGFGIEPSIPDWGLMIAQHYGYLTGNIWWPVLFPALAIASLVVSVNLVADSISQAFE
ncbi:MAG TPA: ABC transporter permease [Acidimicrobiia bacterium]|nr:ABC transporter permease [Acidimicrobiia bacterium]